MSGLFILNRASSCRQICFFLVTERLASVRSSARPCGTRCKGLRPGGRVALKLRDV